MTTRGVRLQRRGSYDVLTADRGEVPRRVTVRFKPVTDGLQRRLSARAGIHRRLGGAVRRAVRLLSHGLDGGGARPARDLNNQPVPAAETALRVPRCRGPVLLGRQAQRQRRDHREGHLRAVRRDAPGGNAGHDRHLRSATAGVDQGVADARRARCYRTLHAGARRAAQLQAHHHGELGGPDAGHLSREGGSVLRGLIVMQYEGAGMLEETDDAAARRACGSSRTRPRISGWARPSATNTRAMPGSPKAAPSCWPSAPWREVDPDYDPRVPLNRAIDDCIRLHAGQRRRERARARRTARLLRLRRGVRAGGRGRLRALASTSSRASWSMPTAPMAWCRAPNGWRRSTTRRAGPI